MARSQRRVASTGREYRGGRIRGGVRGARRVVSGGASARQLVYGATFGGGSRRSTVTRRTSSGRSTTYQVHTTRQFRGKARDDVFDTIRANGAWVLTQFAGIVDDVLGKASNG